MNCPDILLFPILQKVKKQLGGETVTVKSTDFNQIFIVSDAPTPYVIKIPYDKPQYFQSVASEVEVVSVLSEISKESNLSLPSVMASNEDPPYGVFTHVPGISIAEYLASEGHLDEHHRRSIGTSIGIFVAWMAREFSLERYMAMKYSPPPHPFDSVLDRVLEDPAPIRRAGLPSVDAALRQISQLRSRYPVESPIVGHNDLHPGNLLLASMEQPFFTGIIDFGNIQPTSPEHQLQRALRLGPVALAAAVAAYEAESGRKISQDHLQYTLLGRWAAICAYCVYRSKPILTQADYIADYLELDTDQESIQNYNSSLDRVNSARAKASEDRRAGYVNTF